MTGKMSFGIALLLSMLVAILSYQMPAQRMPLEYHAMLTVSIPLAVVWIAIFASCMWRYGKRGLWLILGAPFALWWPIWMAFHHFPSCYYSHNCI
jgi:hypothetical protein